MAKKKTRKPTKAERKQAEEHRWYRRNFAGPGDGERKYTQVEFLDALNRRDRFLFRQRDQIKRLLAKLRLAAEVSEEDELDYVFYHKEMGK